MDFLDQELQAQLQTRREENLARQLRALPPDTLDLGSNDYLGLSRHPHVITSVRIAAEDYGAGARASRLLGGDCELHQKLEQVLAAWKSHPNSSAQSALLFSSGYAANIGVVTALARRGDAIFCDKRNHASLIDACHLAENAGAIVRFYHSTEKLETLLKNVSAPRRLILSDTVYSMDGDLADLPQLLKIAYRNQAILLLDDAHGSGTLGANGQGALHHFYAGKLARRTAAACANRHAQQSAGRAGWLCRRLADCHRMAAERGAQFCLFDGTFARRVRSGSGRAASTCVAF